MDGDIIDTTLAASFSKSPSESALVSLASEGEWVPIMVVVVRSPLRKGGEVAWVPEVL